LGRTTIWTREGERKVSVRKKIRRVLVRRENTTTYVFADCWGRRVQSHRCAIQLEPKKGKEGKKEAEEKGRTKPTQQNSSRARPMLLRDLDNLRLFEDGRSSRSQRGVGFDDDAFGFTCETKKSQLHSNEIKARRIWLKEREEDEQYSTTSC